MPHDRPWCGGPIRPLYAGFDGLDVAFQGCASDRLLALLVDARAEAEAINGPVARELNGLRFTVAPSGARNGFRYRLDTGDDGEVWLIKHNDDRRQWNLFASPKSFALLTHHYAGVKRRLLDERTAQLEATILDARPNRVDFACDLDAPGFEPDPDCFVMPPWMTSRSYHPGESIREGERVEVHRLARRVNGITIGRMPGRQLCLYDKRTDSLVKRKLYWQAVWALDLAEHRDPVWRVEMRAARDELKGRWRVRSFADLEARLPEIVQSALARVRYAVPSYNDSNRSRWPIHPLWRAAEEIMVEAIEAHAFGPAPPRNDLPTPRLIKLDEHRRQLVGLAAGYAGLAGLTEDQVGELPGLVAAIIRDYTRDRPGLLEQKLARARARHGVFGDPALSFQTVRASRSGPVEKAGRFDPEAARRRILPAEPFDCGRIVRYAMLPLDQRWAYHTNVRPIWNEPRPELAEQARHANLFIVTRMAARRPDEGWPVTPTRALVNHHLLDPNAYAFPVRLHAPESRHRGLFEAGSGARANLSVVARAWLTAIGWPDPDADAEAGAAPWLHALAICYAPAWLAENREGILADWPRVPLPASAELLRASAALGARLAALLDPDEPVPGVTSGAPESPLGALGVIMRAGGGPLAPAELAITAGWGHFGARGAVMPGRGRLSVAVIHLQANGAGGGRPDAGKMMRRLRLKGLAASQCRPFKS